MRSHWSAGARREDLSRSGSSRYPAVPGCQTPMHLTCAHRTQLWSGGGYSGSGERWRGSHTGRLSGAHRPARPAQARPTPESRSPSRPGRPAARLVERCAAAARRGSTIPEQRTRLAGWGRLGTAALHAARADDVDPCRISGGRCRFLPHREARSDRDRHRDRPKRQGSTSPPAPLDPTPSASCPSCAEATARSPMRSRDRGWCGATETGGRCAPGTRPHGWRKVSCMHG